jgi:DNA replication protein DnaC
MEFKKIGDIMPKLNELPARTFNCPKHGDFIGHPMKFGDHEWPPDCPKCVEEKAHEEERIKAEIAVQTLINSYKALNIGEKFWDESFETYNAYTPNLQKILQRCRDFADKPKGRKLVMLGNNGNGKTHLAAAILKQTGGVIYTAFEVGLRLHAAFNGFESEWQVFKELCETPVLVIDEVEKVKDSDYNHDWLSYVTGERYKHLRPMVFISNCHLEADCPDRGCPMCLEHNLTNDILARIREDADILKFQEGDYRLRKRIEARRKSA